MKWRINLSVKGIGFDAFCDTREEALAAGFIVLEKLGRGRKEVRVLWSCDGQKSWNLHSSWVLR